MPIPALIVPKKADQSPRSTLADSLKAFLAQAERSRIPSASLSISSTTFPTVEDIITQIQEHELRGDTREADRVRHILRNASKVQMKLLKFHQDVRPGYWGTWTKRSPLPSISKGRNPFAQDSDLLNYDYNSEEEWAEDPEDAEDLGELLSEGEEPSEVDSEDGGWLAGDDEEIEMEEGYEAMDVDPSDSLASAAAAKKKHLQPGLRKTAAAKPLVEIIKGPYFVHGDDASGDEEDEDAAREKEALRRYLAPFSIIFLRECAWSLCAC